MVRKSAENGKDSSGARVVLVGRDGWQGLGRMEDRAERGRGFWLLLHVGRYWYVDDGKEVGRVVGKGRSAFLAPSVDFADLCDDDVFGFRKIKS